MGRQSFIWFIIQKVPRKAESEAATWLPFLRERAAPVPVDAASLALGFRNRHALGICPDQESNQEVMVDA